MLNYTVAGWLCHWIHRCRNRVTRSVNSSPYVYGSELKEM